MTASASAIEIATWAAQAADSKKADNIRIVDGVEEALLTKKIKPVRREGGKEGRWVLLDYVDVIVHVQHADEREFYGLDSLWKDCPEISWTSVNEDNTESQPVEG